MRSAVSNPILTYDQCRDQDFEAVPQFLDHEKALKIHETRWSFLDSMTFALRSFISAGRNQN